MSAEIIPFVPRMRRERRSDESSHAFRSRPQPDDLVMDHADTAPCEIWPSWLQRDDEPA